MQTARTVKGLIHDHHNAYHFICLSFQIQITTLVPVIKWSKCCAHTRFFFAGRMDYENEDIEVSSSKPWSSSASLSLRLSCQHSRHFRIVGSTLSRKTNTRCKQHFKNNSRIEETWSVMSLKWQQFFELKILSRRTISDYRERLTRAYVWKLAL